MSAAMSDISSVHIERSDAMLRNAWIAYDLEGQSIAMGALGMGEITLSDGIATKIVVGRTTWSELMAATGGAPPTAADLLDLGRDVR